MISALFYIAMIVIGFFGLIKGADWLVDGSSRIAARFGMSDLVIGLTIVAFGTSAPELLVSSIAAVSGNADISLGNVVGSNISNLFLILGATAVAARTPLAIKKGTVWKELPFMLLSIVILAIFANDIVIDGGAETVIRRSEGIALLGFFIIFIFYTYGLGGVSDAGVEAEHVTRRPLLSSIGWAVAGLALLVLGGKLAVEGASLFARQIGLSEALIGVTIIALGTSLPELVTSLVAAKKGKVDMAVGNIVGSNLFNVFFVMGITATIAPVAVSQALQFDLAVAVFASLLIFVSMFYGKRFQLDFWKGIQLLMLYVLYIVFVSIRG